MTVTLNVIFSSSILSAAAKFGLNWLLFNRVMEGRKRAPIYLNTMYKYHRLTMCAECDVVMASEFILAMLAKTLQISQSKIVNT